MLRLIMLTTLVIAFQSCRDSYPRIGDQEQLSPFFEYINVDGTLYIDIERSRCLSRTYRISKGFVGSIDKAISLDIKECHKVVGYSPKEYGVFATWLENFRNWLLGFN